MPGALDDGMSRWQNLWAHNRFVVLLAVLLLMLVAVPFAQLVGKQAPFSLANSLVSAVFGILILLSALTVSRYRISTIIAISLAVPTLVAELAQTFTDDWRVQVAHDALAAAFLAYVSVIVLRYLFTSSRVTVNTICASLCVYLLMAVIWALIFSLVEAVQPGAFEIGGGESGLMRFGGQDSGVPLYFSLVTLTTLGYGDILPMTSTSRMLSATEAVVGQIYLTVLVARLVGMHVARSIVASQDE